MNKLSTIINISRNKGRYIILLLLYIPLISCMLSSFNILTTSVSYIDRVTEKYGGTLKIVVSPIGCDIKKAIKQIKDDKYIKSIYYPGVETNSKNLDAKLNVEYVVGNEFKKDEMKIKPPISYIGLNVNLIKYSHEKFEFIEGRIFY